MKYIIRNGDQVVNTIEADEIFCEAYCSAHGYTYEMQRIEPDPEPEPSELDQLRAQVAELQNQILTMRLGGI